MRGNKGALVAAIALLGGCAGPGGESAAPCRLSPVDPGRGDFSVGAHRIRLGEGDNPDEPQAWQGPVAVSSGGGPACAADPDIAILARPLASDGKDRLWVTSYSGSNHQLWVISLASCATLWRSPAATEVSWRDGGFSVGDRAVTLGGDCLPKR